MDVEWDVTEPASLERDAAESAITEELVGAEWSLHRPRAVLVLIAVACLIGLAGVATVTHHSRSPRSAIAASVPAASHSMAPTPTGAAIARIRDLALAPRPLTRYVRATTGDCVMAKPGISPQRRIATAVHGNAPSYRVTDVGFIVEATGAVCALQVRARDGRGDVLVVDVVAPLTHLPDATAGPLVFGSHPDHAGAIEYASGVLPAGWRITVGALGPASRLPGIERLIELTRTRAIRW